MRVAAAFFIASTVVISGWLMLKDSSVFDGSPNHFSPEPISLGHFYTPHEDQLVGWNSGADADSGVDPGRLDPLRLRPVQSGVWSAGNAFGVPAGVELTLDLERSHGGVAAVLRLTGPAVFSIESDSTPVEFSAFLEKGRLDATVEPRSSDEAFVVNTPDAKTRVVGTRFVLTVGDDRTRLRVNEGKVAFLTPDGSTQGVVTPQSEEHVFSSVGLLPPAAAPGSGEAEATNEATDSDRQKAVAQEPVGDAPTPRPQGDSPDDRPAPPSDRDGPSLSRPGEGAVLDQPVPPEKK